MKNPNKNKNVTKGDVFRFELYFSIERLFNEKTADEIANSIFDEVVAKRGGKITMDEFKEIVDRNIPNANRKEEAVENLIEQFDICTSGVCINRCYLRNSEDGKGIL